MAALVTTLIPLKNLTKAYNTSFTTSEHRCTQCRIPKRVTQHAGATDTPARVELQRDLSSTVNYWRECREDTGRRSISCQKTTLFHRVLESCALGAVSLIVRVWNILRVHTEHARSNKRSR